jgi:asparagine synthase (glutamine-hydrolysing)
VRALVASGSVPIELDPDAAYGYFRTGSVPEPHTLLRGVCALGAGSSLTWTQGRVSTKRHWEMPISRPATAPADPVKATRAALLDSVRHHLLADVPVGVFLSAGIDSTAIVALAQALGRTDLRTFSMSLPGSAADEGPDARRTARHFDVPHDQVAIDAVQARAMFAGYLRSADQPSIDGLNTFVVSQFASSLGMKVMLSGVGADELFGGYSSFTQVPRLHAWHRRIGSFGNLASGAGRLAAAAMPGVRARRIGDLLAQAPSLSASYATFRAIFTTNEAARLAERYAGRNIDVAMPALDHDAETDLTPADAISRLELTRYVRNQLLRDADVMSMTWGLELRTPFLDRELATVLTSIPASARLREQKHLLREAVPELPDWVTGSRKRCFQFPFDDWMPGEWRDVFGQIERTSSVPMETWYRKWCVFALDHWMKNLKQNRDV